MCEQKIYKCKFLIFLRKTLVWYFYLWERIIAKLPKTRYFYFGAWQIKSTLVYLYYNRQRKALYALCSCVVLVVPRGTANCVIAVPRSWFFACLRAGKFFRKKWKNRLTNPQNVVVYRCYQKCILCLPLSWNWVRIPASRSLWYRHRTVKSDTRANITFLP